MNSFDTNLDASEEVQPQGPALQDAAPRTLEEGRDVAADPHDVRIEINNLDAWYGGFQALKSITLEARECEILALIGPSGCGKSTFLRCLNRMNDLIPDFRATGEVLLDGESVLSKEVDPVLLRTRVGMVFQRPNPFPMSIYDNVAYGPRLHGRQNKSDLDETVERSLKRAALWDEVSDKLQQSALSLSGGQQQRLCIARVLAVEPEVLLMDEPASALDPISTLKIEELMRELQQSLTIVIVTHNMQQAARVSDRTGFFLTGELIEVGTSDEIFTCPRDTRTEDYITGRFG
jgi:phosphate transport system ATP-binding protein